MAFLSDLKIEITIIDINKITPSIPRPRSMSIKPLSAAKIG
jgi:hypothetical protein